MHPSRQRRNNEGTATRTAVPINKIRKRRSSCTITTSKVALNREIDTYAASPSTDSHSSFEVDSDSCSDPDSDSDDSGSQSDSYSDTDTDPNIQDAEQAYSGDFELDSEQGSDEGSDSEAERIVRNIEYHRTQGPAKPRHEPRTIELWKRESDFWQRYCSKIQRKTNMSPEEQLRACDPAVFKSYLWWRKKHSRINKESTMKSYWKRISMYYRDLTDHEMDNDVLSDICNWMPNLHLDKSKKEKFAMFVQDLYAILHALWVDDTKALPGFIRDQLSLLLIISAATATRPGAIVQLQFKDIELLKVRCVEDPSRSTLVANVNLEHVKNKDKEGTPKKFTFRLEGLPAFCVVSHILGIGDGRNAFKDGFTSIQQIFDLVIPEERNALRIRWKHDMLKKPFFCDVEHTAEGAHILEDKSFPYAKYRDLFVRLGRVAGFEQSLELYQLRRASGKNINEAFTESERNQTMGHLGSTYEKYYTPTHIARDFQAVYFGTPTEDLLIQSVARMGLTRDQRAPVELDENQKEEVRNNPKLVALREQRDNYKNELYEKGFYPLSKGKTTSIYKKYQETVRKLNSTNQGLCRKRLEKAIREFHTSIDSVEIARQLDGKPTTDLLTKPAVSFELRERAVIAHMLFKPFENEKARVRFITNFARLCKRQEMRRPVTLKRKRVEFVVSASGEANPQKCREIGRLNRGLPCQSGEVTQEPDLSECEEVQARQLYPMVSPYPICLFCIGNERLSYEQRTKPWPRKDVLNKHVDTHFRNPEFQGEFTCRHPSCSCKLNGKMHFKRHSLEVHQVSH
ncbi:hypothetical protein BU24DRAFT_469047 [Aaosphaeria arxii CBS 175.79]|uniref:C2H2-type domain-containing protein n=1 Tax=Aaosphaeria arxii CBS 175.79 TaxID=1450172 RepID=A0A6A5X618_9PLEO|nr:uncharacterized protein BU24DRAFT_469047 [Aaosphaeria arxii CBS 175.79]KAF2008362.1 hypothetical protein BU24DRAFT_469047 [Aaosphaeria arxii CBS 175.79]